MSDHSFPALHEVESPNPPEVIARNQAQLSRLQTLPTAWGLSRDLLDRPEQVVKFFGVLTIIVKLNTESSSLNKEDAQDILGLIIKHYAIALVDSSQTLVARKLSSAISTFFIYFHESFPGILANVSDHVVQHTGSPMAGSRYLAIRSSAWVLTNVLEDCSKLDLNTSANAKLYESITALTEDAADMLHKLLSEEAPADAVLEDCLKCVQAWVWFFIKSSVRDTQAILPLRRILGTVIDRLSLSSSGDTSMELLGDVLNSYPSLITAQQSAALLNFFISPQSQPKYQELMGCDVAHEVTQFANLLLAYADTNHETLMQQSDSGSHQLLSNIRDLLSIEGYPVVDDTLFVPIIEFWSNFAETLAGEMSSDDESTKPWAQQALSYVISAISLAWQKTVFPPSEVVASWDSSDRVGFHDARKDLVDLLQATYALVGPEVVITFCNIALENVNSKSWLRVEAAIACLSGLADCARDDSRCDESLALVFSSPLFGRLKEEQSSIPHRLRKSAVSLIENYTDYFERNSIQLPAALQLLFAVVGDPSIASSASKSIFHLCSSCRHHLYPEVESFLEVYSRMSAQQSLDCICSERLLGAIASVAQAIPDQSYMFQVASRLINVVEQEIHTAQKLKVQEEESQLPCAGVPRCYRETADDPPSMHLTLRALKSLLLIGKGFKAQQDGPFDVDKPSEIQHDSSDGASKPQGRILRILQEARGPNGLNAEIADLSWSTIRCGFSETSPGPFVFPAEDVAIFILQHDTNTPALGQLIKMTCSLMSSLTDDDSRNNQQILKSLSEWVIGLLSRLPAPESDTELSQNGTEFLTRLSSRATNVLFCLVPRDMLEFFLIFTLKVLDGKEPLPKSAAADFWTTLAGLQSDHPEVQATLAKVMVQFGPLLCQTLMRNVGGKASRSELDKLSEPIKRVVSRCPEAKSWLENALCDPGTAGVNLGSQERSMFVKKVLSLRGSRQTNQVIRDFWLSSRGTNFAYAS